MDYNPSKDSNLKQEDFEPFKNKGRADLLILAKETGNRMKIIFLVIVGAYAVIASSGRIHGQEQRFEAIPPQCDQSSDTTNTTKTTADLDYFIEQGKFRTVDDLIPPGCLAQLMTELNGDDSVAAVFLSRTRLRGCIDANYPYPGGDEEKIDYQIVSKMESDTYKVRVCQSVDGSLRESCSKIIVRFVNRPYRNKGTLVCVLSLEKLGEF